MSIILRQPEWKIARAGHILRHYGTWEKVREAARYDHLSGTYMIKIPPELRRTINADPKCKPKEKRSIIVRILDCISLK